MIELISAATRMKVAVSALALVLAGCGGGISNDDATSGPVPVVNAAVGDGGVPSFYVWTSRVPGTPGRLLRQEALDENLTLDNSNASKNVRMLYTSTDGVDGKTPIAVSGAVYFPKGIAPSGGWPIIAWTHGTVGVADVCAQSFRERSDRDKSYLGTLIGQGYAVVATDYQGLGTPGPHPYELTRAEAYSELDMLRAALRTYPSLLANKIAVVGQSQGSGATIGTLNFGPKYSPELNLVGGVATGVAYATSGTTTAPQLAVPTVSGGLIHLAALATYDMYIWGGLGPAELPGFTIRPNVTDAALPLQAMTTTSCLDDMEAYESAHGLTEGNYLKSLPPTSELTTILGVLPNPISELKLTKPLFYGDRLGRYGNVPAGSL